MVQKTATTPTRRLNVYGRMIRRARILARLGEGWTCAEIAGEEGLTPRRIRQIVSEARQNRKARRETNPAMLRLAFGPALEVAAQAVASGDLEAIRRCLKLLDWLDPRLPAVAAARSRRGKPKAAPVRSSTARRTEDEFERRDAEIDVGRAGSEKIRSNRPQPLEMPRFAEEKSLDFLPFSGVWLPKPG